MGKLASLVMPKVKTPKLEAPAKMPDPQDPALLEERRKKLATMRGRGGRADTVLSDALIGSAGKVGA